VVPSDIHDFFAASAGVAGALIGLLFVAISVSGARLSKGPGSQVHRIRARAALLAFNNALIVSLFALIPGEKIAVTAVAVSSAGIVFIVASLISLARVKGKHWATARDAFFLVGMAVVFYFQLTDGLALNDNPGDTDAVNAIAFLVVFSFLIGIYRAWELIGGPDIALSHEVFSWVRGDGPGTGETKGGAGESAGSASSEAEPAKQSD
jgi:hypothetical protein